MNILSVIMIGALIALWGLTLVLIYIQGNLDILHWCQAWLKWGNDPSLWAPRPPKKAPIGWSRLVGLVLISIGVTVITIISLIGGK